MSDYFGFSRGRPRRAIILAAGTGSRLREEDGDLPKPLRRVGSLPLLTRVLLTLGRAGIREAVIVLGFEADAIREALSKDPMLEASGIHLEFVLNDNFHAKNGLSLLAARDYVNEECVLSMADHIYSASLVRRLAARDLPDGVCALAIDHDIPRCFDLEDATKVRLEGHLISGIGKELEQYDALDTGVFRISPSLIERLDHVAQTHGDCSLSDGVQALSDRGLFWGCDIGDARWVDVDTPQAASFAEVMLGVYGDDLEAREPQLAAMAKAPLSALQALQAQLLGGSAALARRAGYELAGAMSSPATSDAE